MENNNQAYKAITRICLNNWHYIDAKVLHLNKEINFFTGHSGSGKSTVIDAIQMVLYANTDGRSFFNKAAADDSDRSLIEYLRGMVNIGENNQAEYKRNRNFSTTIVLELEQTVSGEKECAGILFDVETATNEYSRLFFWHKGGLFGDFYRRDGRALSIGEMKDAMQNTFSREDYFFTSSSERFRRNLYDIYLGGLDMEKFPRLFKRAIPFRMNIKLEDFVKEYICMEQDIHIEEMQESVVLYGRMRRKIEDAMEEIGELAAIGDKYREYRQSREQEDLYRYRLERLYLLQLELRIMELQDKAGEAKKDISLQRESEDRLTADRAKLQLRYDQVNRELAGSGYADAEAKLSALEEHMQLLDRSILKWERLSEDLGRWEEEDAASNQMLWDIEKFRKGSISGEEIERLKKSLKEVSQEAEKQRHEAQSELRSLKKEYDTLENDLVQLKLGKKTYPRELEEARREIEKKLYDKYGKSIPVKVLADMLDIRDEKWRNAIEGYLGANKLTLMVEPKYVRDAMEVIETLDGKRFFRVSLADTERILEQENKGKEGALWEEVEAREPYVSAFLLFLLGNVMKCDSVESLRRCRMGVTADCMLYQNFQLRRLNPEYYTKKAYIGEKSLRQRQKELQASLEDIRKRMEELEGLVQEAGRLGSYEYLTSSSEDYLVLLRDMEEKKDKEKQKKRLEKQLEEIGAGTVEGLKEEIKELSAQREVLERQIEGIRFRIHDRELEADKESKEHLAKSAELEEGRRRLSGSQVQAEEFERFLSQIRQPRYDRLIGESSELIRKAGERSAEEKNILVDIRTEYLRKHPHRAFSPSGDDNKVYEELLNDLSCDSLTEFQEKASQQAVIAIEHFKEDFIYKIRSAIKEAYIRRDELNRIIRKLNFGKDKYQFRITRNRGIFGEYYDMFMDESLEIDPSTLSSSMKNQVNLFSMEHENKYGTLMNDLIHVFLPPDSANAREQEEALANMLRYGDYRTYLSFEMEQIVEGEERLVIGLSRMIRKNSGGEGQNPLYVALLASFAQAYHINQTPRLSRRPTIRLVVLDEAFSKMDAEKVASCIELIRGLGFQAIISATNDKIQNYLENVDKTFVYANPNKKSISIQEFEKKDFTELNMEAE